MGILISDECERLFAPGALDGMRLVLWARCQARRDARVRQKRDVDGRWWVAVHAPLRAIP